MLERESSEIVVVVFLLFLLLRECSMKRFLLTSVSLAGLWLTLVGHVFAYDDTVGGTVRNVHLQHEVLGLSRTVGEYEGQTVGERK
jgi:hypothetical protein